MIIYTSETIKSELSHLKDWYFENNSIVKNFKFNSFSQALGFIIQVGLAAEKRNHHPELLNNYDKVSIRLTTHDAKGVTNKDLDLAKAIDVIA
ncbi:4a-hydroxytetrahydrobiopterin dehydratase [Flavobacterium sp.]|uniref:4a-hydroxytetrahydrobiopterin dehydratase n=1 Tax=Flavobacterium sp. TaxID=239 RepID=UPI00286D58DA|nr:4a-hydroxytetrahydrobiopterin dehydratase [Flavobacterium sp.]